MENIFTQHPWIIVVILLWTLPWKGAALWKAARRGHLGWFLTLILLNTLGILDIIYIFFFSGPSAKEKDEKQNEVRQAKMSFREHQARKQEQEMEKQIPQPQAVEVQQVSVRTTYRKRQTII